MRGFGRTPGLAAAALLALSFALTCATDSYAGEVLKTLAPMNTKTFMILYHFFGFLWTNQFIQGMGMMVIAGAVAEWYWTPTKQGKKKGRLNELAATVAASIAAGGCALAPEVTQTRLADEIGELLRAQAHLVDIFGHPLAAYRAHVFVALAGRNVTHR